MNSKFSTEIKRASVQETFENLNNNPQAVMIDVREEQEILDVAPSLGKCLPMSKLNPDTFDRDCGVTKDQPIYLFCRSGNRSMRVAMALQQVGFKDLTNVEGGIIAWSAAGLPTKRG